MITIAISETNEMIKPLSLRLFSSFGRHCSSSLRKTDSDFIFCTPKPKKHYDIVVEHCMPSQEIQSDYMHLINSDEVHPPSSPEHSIWITYGLNPFATVTASSIRFEENILHFQYCLQRNIVSLKGKQIEPQEFPVSLFGDEADLHSALACVTLALIIGISADKLKEIQTK